MPTSSRSSPGKCSGRQQHDRQLQSEGVCMSSLNFIKACVLFLLMSASAVLADGSAALKMAPRGANAVMTIDVAKLIASPVGKAADLQSKLIGGYADRPLAVPATARNVTLVAGVHPVGMDSVWE